jgi:hypothetical protein
MAGLARSRLPHGLVRAVPPLEAPLSTVALAGHAPVAINLNQPGTYLNWWNGFITISVANLVLIAVMVAIFGAADDGGRP